MNRPSTSFFINKWKSMPKSTEQIISLGILYTNREKDIIDKLQANNILVCLYRLVENSVNLI